MDRAAVSLRNSGERPVHLRRGLLLALILLAFARLCWHLDAHNLWWDESLSLQRAESGWLALLQGHLVMRDGISELLTIDQHPFFYFVLQGLLLRGAGIEEFVLRFPSVMAATLLVPVLWALGRRLVARGVLAAGSAEWAALLAALNPFFLWYGQEARPYALWAMLAVLSTYLLLRVTEEGAPSRPWLVGYLVTLLAFLTTHYYAALLLPVHALLCFGWLRRRAPQWAWVAAFGLLAVGGVVAGAGAWLILKQGGGENFRFVPLRIMLPDLLNAFSMGLSVDIDQVWWLDLVFGALALVGIGWGLRSRKSMAAGGWLLPTFLGVPILLLLAVSRVQPAYMNARHLSLLSGAFVLLVAAGLAAVAQRQRWAAAGLALLLVAGVGYSTANYFTRPEYGKDDYTGAGHYLAERLLPGDLLLLNPPFSWRIFDYYLPVDLVEQGAREGKGTAVYGVPFLHQGWEEIEAGLERLRGQYRRIWLVTSGTHPYLDPERRVKAWLEQNTVRLKKESFYSPTSFLDVELFLTQVPVFTRVPADMEHPADVVFGDQIRLVGYSVGQRLAAGSALPVTLYWQTEQPTDVHYKYILRLLQPAQDGEPQVLATTEREPYDGVIPTIYWKPGEIIMEYSELPPAPLADDGRYLLALQMYHAETLEKLPITQAPADAQIDADGVTLLLPYTPAH
ncbi:glycosyltransferase family 39 protein [Litorilinea aerophila]|nr:glycosyltransferase family 39 protein [Litorilinea aerophila]MCC9077564.1 glycosyltransferase family 39 protein [Litorilinea aerophila]